MATNKHKVPKRQWYKWSDQAQAVFNDVFDTMRRNKELFLHPSLQGIGLFSREQWKTTCWNAAWIAADAVRK